MLLVKRLGKYFGHKNNLHNANFVKRKKFYNHKDKEASTSTQDVTCYECGKQGHIKPDCPKLSKKNGFKGKKEFKNKKAYVAWEDNEISSSSDSESEECANLALMASHHSDNEEEVSNEFNLFDDDVQDAIDELLKECKSLYKKVSNKEKELLICLEKIDTMTKDFDLQKQNFIKEKENFACSKCESNVFQIVQLKRVIERYEKGQIGLEGLLSQQRYPNDKRGLGYVNTKKPSNNPTVFVKASNSSNPKKVEKKQVVHNHQKKKANVSKKKTFPKKKSYPSRYRSNFEPTCFYCGIKGHTPNACYVRNFSIASGHYVWVKKGTNYEGPKATWVPNKK